MADGLEITFEGMGQIRVQYGRALGLGCRRRSRAEPCGAAGQVVQAAITEAAPVRPVLPSGTALPPGALKADIELHVVKERDGSVSAYIEPGRYTRHAARWVEYGHRLVRGGRLKKGGAHIGDVPAYPFIRPAFEASEGAALAAAEESVALELSKEAKRLGY